MSIFKARTLGYTSIKNAVSSASNTLIKYSSIEWNHFCDAQHWTSSNLFNRIALLIYLLLVLNSGLFESKLSNYFAKMHFSAMFGLSINRFTDPVPCSPSAHCLQRRFLLPGSSFVSAVIQLWGSRDSG